jgi:enoyl-CoA hydratase
MTEPLVHYRIPEPRIALISIERPQKKNAINTQIVEELAAAWARFESGEERVAILTGYRDEVFTGGADLKDMPPDFWKCIPGAGSPVSKPLIAATAGLCVGGGMVLVAMCDLAVAAENSVFAYPEAQVGYTGGMISNLAARIPHKIAMEIMMLGESVDAQRAHAAGYVNRVVPVGRQVEVALDMARRLEASSPVILRTLKDYVGRLLPKGPSEAAAIVRRELMEVNSGEDATEGLTSFREKRKPRFTGR